MPPLQRSHCYPGYFKILRCSTELFRNSFLPFTVNEWNKLDSDIKNSDSYAFFRLSAFLRPVGNSIYGIYDPFGVRLNFAKFLRTRFLQNTSGRLLLDQLIDCI